MILMNNFNEEPKQLRKEMHEAAKRVIDSGWYVLGREVELFEKVWADTCGVQFAVGVGNGMDAIEIGLRAIGIKSGDEVITTSMTAFATVLAILRAGGTPVLADINSETALLSIDSVRACISKKTKAIVLVHLYGQVRDMQSWIDLCKEYNVELIEDCAQSHLAIWKGKTAGSFGRLGAYSFYPTKNLGALGDAGMIITNDESIAKQAGYLRNYGQTERYYHPEIGLNSRLDEMQAAILSVRERWLSKFTKRRQEIANAYYEGISNPLVKLAPQPQEASSHVYHLFVITCETRDLLQGHLKANSIQSLIHYPVPIHNQESCRDIMIASNGLPNSERYALECLSLPCHPQMTNKEVSRVISSVNSYIVS